MDVNPKISVVVPLYNKAENIGDTLDSILGQTYNLFEIIVVDDGSTDGGGDVVGKYTSRGVTLVRQGNQGVSAARNAGVAFATAEYIAFLDADDYWHPNHLDTLCMLIRKCPSAGLFCTAYNIHRNGEFYKTKSMFKEGWNDLVPNFISSYKADLSLVSSTTACVRKKVFMEIGGFPVGVRRGEDIVAWVKLAIMAPVAHAAIVTATYNRDGVNRSDLVRDIDEPSGALQFMASLLIEDRLNGSLIKPIEGLFDKIAILTAAGCQLNNNRSGVFSIIILSIKTRRLVCAFVVFIISCMPIWIMKLMRDFRHRRVGA